MSTFQSRLEEVIASADSDSPLFEPDSIIDRLVKDRKERERGFEEGYKEGFEEGVLFGRIKVIQRFLGEIELSLDELIEMPKAELDELSKDLNDRVQKILDSR